MSKNRIQLRVIPLISVVLVLSTLGPVSGLKFGDEFLDVVAPDAEVKLVTDGFRFTEGPVADARGDIYFTDIPNQKILHWSVKDRELTTLMEESGQANGLAFDRKGNLIACAHATRRVFRIDFKEKKPARNENDELIVTTVVDAYQDKKLNSPNDLWIDRKGGIYFTDPRYGRNRTNMEQDGEHVYYLQPNGKQLSCVAKDLVRPNGIFGSPDGHELYIADHGDNKTWRYTIGKNGLLSDKKLFCEAGSDGMTMDEESNLYLTGDSVDVYNYKGTKIRTIEVPERPSNVTFGDSDRKTLFITARTGLYSLQMRVSGL